MLFKNQVFEHKESGKRVRILDSDNTTSTVWIFIMGDKKALPKAYEMADLKSAIDRHEFVKVSALPNENLLHLSDAAKQRQQAAYECIEPLIKTIDIFDPSKRSAMVASRAQECRCSPQTIFSYLRAWWRNGQSRNSLTPQFHRIGGIAGDTANRGRRPHYITRPIYQLTLRDREWMDEALKKFYLKSEVVTLTATYQRLLEKHYSYIDSEGSSLIKAPGEYPTESQFRWFVKKNLPREVSLRARKGDAAFELNHRAKLGSLRHETYTVGDTYEIDATIADCYLVSQHDRSKIIGKPVLYMVRDRKSNLCVGFYIGIENASWIAAMHAIKSIAEDKEILCNRYGIAYEPNDWPAHGILPKTLIADRGSDMLSGASTQIADGLEITVQNLPSRRGDWKPHVECGFKQTQRAMADCIPAYVPPENFGKRQTKDYSQDAALTLHEFSKIVISAIIRFNRSPISAYRQHPNQILDGMQPTPINIWNTEIRERAGLLTQYSEEQIRFALLPRMQATVTREGIRIGNCYYSAPEALAKQWFVTAARGSFKVTVSYDRRLVDAIYVHDDRSPDSFFIAQLLDKCSHFRGMSFSEVESLDYLSEILRQQGEHSKRQLQADFHAQVDPVVTNAVREAKVASKGKSRSARKKDIVQARAQSLTLQRQSEAQITPQVQMHHEPAKVVPMPASKSKKDVSDTSSSPAEKTRQQKYQELMNGQ